MSLSAHFTLEEFLRSETAARHDVSMTPSESVRAHLERLAKEVLEPIRLAVGLPITITSGYRPMELNRLIGGAPNSDHIYGRAADFVVNGLELRELARIVRKECESLPVAKCIQEFNAWVHVSIEPVGTEPRRQFMVATRQGGQTVYRPWEVA